MAGDIEMDDAAAAADRKKRSRRGRADSRQSLRAINEAIVEAVALLGPRVGGLRERKIGDEEMIGLKSDRRVLHAFETAQQQAGADEEQHRQRNFGGR